MATGGPDGHMNIAATRLRMPAVVRALRFHSLENSAFTSLFEASEVFLDFSVSPVNHPLIECY